MTQGNGVTNNMTNYMMIKEWVAGHEQKEDFMFNLCQVAQLKIVYEVNSMNNNMGNYRMCKE